MGTTVHGPDGPVLATPAVNLRTKVSTVRYQNTRNTHSASKSVWSASDHASSARNSRDHPSVDDEGLSQRSGALLAYE